MPVKAKKPAPLKSREEMEACVERICTHLIQLDTVKTNLDEELAITRNHHEPYITELENVLEVDMSLAQTWSKENREIYGNKKSVDMKQGRVGYRLTTPKLKNKVGWPAAKVLQYLVEKAPAYVRTKREPDRERILRDRKLLKGVLPEIGLRVTQSETFYVEPKRDTKQRIKKQLKARGDVRCTIRKG